MRLSLRRPRGQNLVLFALTMLFLTLLVTMTLSTGMKVKEKMEVQAVADAAAYTNAATTARVFNEVALLQRAQIGHFVAMSSVQALISWTGFWRTQIENMKDAYRWAEAPYAAILVCCALPVPEPFCKPRCVCAAKAIFDIERTISKLNRYQRSLRNGWDSADGQAGTQLKNLQIAAVDIWQQNQSFRRRYLQAQLGADLPAGSIVNAAKGGGRWAGEWSSAMSAAVINTTEAGVLKDRREQLPHHLHAALGSRGYTFTTNRSMGGPMMTGRMLWWFQQNGATPDIPFLTNTGNAYWGRNLGMHDGGRSDTSAFAWADDHGSASVVFLRQQAPCFPSFGRSSSDENDTHLKSTDQRDRSDKHRYLGDRDRPNQPHQRHTLGVCNNNPAGNCPGMWSGFVDYNKTAVTDPTAYFGQPFNLAVIQRDYSTRGQRADPWNLAFRFRFTPQNPDTEFDNSGINLSDGTPISKQTAVSSGVAYYHRAGHWKEPPNFLNPYWRATLVPISMDIDERVVGALAGAGATWAGEAYMSLKAAGFKDYEKIQ
jgi:Flp pilus assembly protein TadG